MNWLAFPAGSVICTLLLPELFPGFVASVSLVRPIYSVFAVEGGSFLPRSHGDVQSSVHE